MNQTFIRFFTIFLLFSLFLTGEDISYKEESRLILSGFSVPQTEMIIPEIPLHYNGDFPLIMDGNQNLWVFLFMQEDSPLYSSTKNAFNNASWNRDPIKAYIISTNGEDDLTDTYGRAASLFGFSGSMGVLILKGDGEVIGWMKNNVPDWENPNLILALEEAFN